MPLAHAEVSLDLTAAVPLTTCDSRFQVNEIMHSLFVATLAYIFFETRRVPTNDGADDLDQDEAELEGAGYRYAQHEGECSAQRR